MSIQPQVLTKATGLSVKSGGDTFELQLADQCLENIVRAVISSPSSLSAGYLKAEIQDGDGNWIGAPQEVMLLASGGGTPAVVDGNAASATAIVGGRARNTTGLTAITNTATVLFRIQNCGRPVRMSFGSTSGTGVLALEHTGLLAIA